ncbi:MAG TPA: TonB-dependent receptor [Candidatus Acidoferrales bacterium]|nr:TonB-dependent receptor [Candidatus Acidoferrales bacterium]
MKKHEVVFFAVMLFYVAANGQNKFSLTGIIFDSTDNSRIAIARIALLSSGETQTRMVLSNTEGEFEFTDIPQGPYLMEVSAGGYNAERISVAVPSIPLIIYLARKTYNLLPVLVTAQLARGRQSPVTFSEMPDTTINSQFAFQDIPVLLSQLPSITEYSENGEGIGYSYITMRGFDQRRISIMVNGIPQNDPEDHNVYWIDMPDLQASTESIQVQRGAGNEFYGAPAIGGSIDLETTNPANEREMNFTYGMGSTGSNGYVRRYSTTLSSGLIGDRYSVYAHLAKNMTDGYRQDSWVNLDSYFLNAARYDDNVTTELNFYGGPISDGLSYLGLPKFAALDKNLRTQNWDDWNSDSNQVNYSPHMTRFIANGDTVYAVPRRGAETENFSQPHFELLNEWRISPTLAFKNSLFMILGSGFYDYDGSWADTSYFRITPQYGFRPSSNPSDALIHAYEDLKQYGWLPCLTIRHYDGTLVLGAELDQNYSDHWASIRWANNLPANLSVDYHYNEWHARTDVATAYGHELFDVSPQLTLMLDLEYEFKQYKFYGETFVGNTFDVPYHFVNPRIGLNYNITPESNIYFSLSQTSHEPQLASIYNADESSGGEVPHFALNPDSTLNFGEPLIKPETLNDFELGYHSANNRFSLGLTAYWMEFYNELVSNGELDQYGQPIDGNAQRTRHIGLEFETAANLTNEFSIYGNLSLSRNRIIHYIYYETEADSLNNSIVVPDKLDGNRIGGFPELLGNIRATYALGGFAVALLGQYVGSQYTDNFELLSDKIDPYFIVNGWISYKVNNFLSLSSVEFKLYCNNLLNKLYIAHGEGQYFYPAATRNLFLNCSINL